jgi:hypothetical protein
MRQPVQGQKLMAEGKCWQAKPGVLQFESDSFMRILNQIVRWTSLVGFVLLVVILGLSLFMRARSQTDTTSFFTIILGLAPSILFFGYIFLFTWYRSFSLFMTIIGVISIGWVVYWLWFSGSFDFNPQSGREALACVFAPFAVYWLAVSGGKGRVEG